MNELRLLSLAVALDQHRNFGRAAEAAGVTQPTFSRAIASLEAAVRTRLFDRSNRRVEPTPAGQVLLARARALLAESQSLRDALGEYQNLRSGRIAIGVGPYPLDISVAESVARLNRRFPLLQIEVIEGQWRDFGPKVLSGEVELAVVEASIVATDPRFRVERFPAHQGHFYCRTGHPLAKRRQVSLPEILEFPLVGVRIPGRALPLPLPSGSGLLIDPVSGDLLPRITTTSVAASRAIVGRTDGIGLAVSSQIAEDVRAGKLAVLPFQVPTLRTAYGIAYLEGKSLSPGAEAFIGVLRQVEAEIASPRAESSRMGQGKAPRRRAR
jgi:DNA-binding transcriptional LysR family regulator